MVSQIHSAIDVVQNAKKSFLTTYVTEDSVREPLEAFVDTQTVFAKQVAQTSWDMGHAFLDAVNNVLVKTPLRK